MLVERKLLWKLNREKIIKPFGSDYHPTPCSTITRRYFQMTISSLLTQLEAQKDGILLEIESWSSEDIKYRPTPDGWSAIKVLDHLVRTEVSILASARNGLLKPHTIGITDKLRTRFIQTIFRSDRKVKVPSTASHVLPGSDLELPVIIRAWADSRLELSELLTNTPQAELSKGIFRHPVAGWMGMPEILDFFSVHIIHHNYQLARLRDAIRPLPAVRSS